MEKVAFECRTCRRKTYQNLSNRCQYCGADLPEHMKMDKKARETYVHELESINEESEAFARGMSRETLFEQELRRKKREAAQKKKPAQHPLLNTNFPPGD